LRQISVHSFYGKTKSRYQPFSPQREGLAASRAVLLHADPEDDLRFAMNLLASRTHGILSKGISRFLGKSVTNQFRLYRAYRDAAAFIDNPQRIVFDFS
jgi:hypothetical protein